MDPVCGLDGENAIIHHLKTGVLTATGRTQGRRKKEAVMELLSFVQWMVIGLTGVTGAIVQLQPAKILDNFLTDFGKEVVTILILHTKEACVKGLS